MRKRVEERGLERSREMAEDEVQVEVSIGWSHLLYSHPRLHLPLNQLPRCYCPRFAL